MSRKYRGPYANPGFAQQVNEVVEPRIGAVFSGEFTSTVRGYPLGAAKYAGRVEDAWFSVGASGKDDAETLSMTVDVKINGTSCLSTKPIIAHVSGEVSGQKTTKETGDTGVTQAIINADACTYSPGDLFTADVVLTRTASPTTEVANIAVVVELEPNN
jgi:hypothetical protein